MFRLFIIPKMRIVGLLLQTFLFQKRKKFYLCYIDSFVFYAKYFILEALTVNELYVIINLLFTEVLMGILRLSTGDLIEMKKAHPCSSSIFKVLRVGSDVRILCTKCARDITLPREKLEKMVKRVINN